MSLAETAHLAVNLSLQGNFTSGLTAAESRLTGFNSAASSGVSRFTAATGKLSGALGHAGGQIKGLITGPLGLIGLGTALFSVGGAIEEGVKRAVTFGDEVRQMSAVTGLSAETTSALAAALEHFGITADTAIRLTGFLEKNVGLLAAKKDGIAKFGKEFSFALTDSNGHLKDANELLLTSADYFNNKAIPATEKAAAMSKLYGRSWQELIPFLKAGRQGISDAEAEARNLGLTLTGDNVAALAKLKTATRDWNTALGGLELQIGLALVPELTKLASTATAFVSQHGHEIVDFFKNAGKFAEEAGGTIGNLVGAISTFWNGLPPEFRRILVTGVVADRSFKFLFGFDPLSLGKSLFSGVFGEFAARGSSPANPVFVSGGGLGDGAGGSTGGGIVKTIGTAVGLAGIALELKGGVDALTSELGHLQAGDTRGAIRDSISLSSPGDMIARAIFGTSDPIGDLIRGLDGSRPKGASGVVNVVDNSPGARDERAAALKSATANATTAAHTEGLRSGLTTLQQRLVAKQETANAKLAVIADKRESNRISQFIRIPITIHVAGSKSEAGATVRRTVTRNGAPVAF